MSTTDPILAALAAQRAEHQAAGRLPEVQRVDQQVIAVQTLARLADDRKAAQEAGDQDAVAAIDTQGQFWARQVDLDALRAAVAGETEPPAGGDQPAAAPATRTKAR